MPRLSFFLASLVSSQVSSPRLARPLCACIHYVSPPSCTHFCMRRQNNSLTILLAVWAIFCIDFGINAGKDCGAFYVYILPVSLPLQCKRSIALYLWTRFHHRTNQVVMHGLRECSVLAVSRDSSCKLCELFLSRDCTYIQLQRQRGHDQNTPLPW